MDPVLATARPAFDASSVVKIARQAFDVGALDARDLGSERDQTFLLLGEDAAALAVMKVSNAAEDPATLDMEALGVLHIARVDPSIPLAIPRPVPGATSGSTDPADRRATYEAEDGVHHVRMYDVLPGRGRVEAGTLADDVLGLWGEMAACVGRALRGFFHPAARRTMLWDVQHTAQIRELLETIRDPSHRELVERALDRFDTAVTPVWPSLRAQVIHGDLTTDNALVDDDGRITGIIDFGDMSHTALVTDIASLLDSLLNGRDGDELFRAGRLVLDGYQRITPLEPVELALTGELLAARAAVTIAISSFRSDRGLEDAGFAQRYNDGVARTIETLLDVGWDEAARRFGSQPLGMPRPTPGLAERREEALGPAMEFLTYAEPIEVVSAEGVWMIAADGRRYLDAYNNVPCVGHSHPRVAEAIARQGRLVTTNMRYLHPAAIELAERLVATMPPGAGLDTVLFVNSGSEANDVAWRLATTFTGKRGALCTEFAYHGVTEATAALSPESWHAGRRPDHVETWAPPDRYRGANLEAAVFEGATDQLAARGLAPAAVILDSLLTSDGFLDPGAELTRDWVARARAAGALWIADEVQGGHGRTGEAMWSFERLGIVPDLVTLGKPMGNGHPVGAVITRREIAARFGDETVFFSTFGGNQVSAIAALAVLDVLRDERVLERVVAAGAALQAGIREVAARYPIIGDVRGVGLAIGVEIVRDPVTRAPDPDATTAIREGLKERGVLVGTTGRPGNVLKIRPPLAFTESLVHIVTGALEASLVALTSRD
ncbi:MAG TPA: aminotransferase class III-fold pyridoxal phosphate-dependent enzyme [Candidatus Limnocylindrales bacterium]|nr:aminotransferase class III-fold pyridoxal phosphate-dependent enzyme [Candidatus Limnocylindrales bacterium]